MEHSRLHCPRTEQVRLTQAVVTRWCRTGRRGRQQRHSWTRGDDVSGNASFRAANTTVLSVCAVEAPIVITSAAIDEWLAETYQRVHTRPGMLQKLAGVVERRWWPEDVSFADAAAIAGAKALAEAGIQPEQVGVMINTAVSRAYLEPSTAVAIHHQMGLPTDCLNFDLANACLGFLNGIQLAATMIDSGQAEYAVIVDGEGSRYTQELTLERLAGPDVTAADLRSQFATLTLGSGSGRHGARPRGPSPGGPSRRRWGEPGWHRASRPLRRRPHPHADRHEAPLRRRPRAGGGDVG